MRQYQQLLTQAMEQHGWHLDEIGHPDQWWIAEQWTVSSVRERHGLRLFCTFIVDPQSGSARDLSAVRTIVFTQEPLTDWRQTDDAPVVLSPAQRTFPIDINSAMERLDALRIHTPEVA